MQKLLCGSALMFSASVAFAGQLVVPEGYSDFRSPGSIVVDRPMSMVLEQVTAFPESLGGKPELTLKSWISDENRLVIDIVETGFLDDSVKGANRLFEFTETADGKYKLETYGYRQQCYRGGDPNVWVAEPCL
ncbi:MAG: hypothetical protein AAF478_02245 [Pseudomonadota bacterium]